MLSEDKNDCGLTQINLYWHLKRKGIKDTLANRKIYREKLLSNKDYNLLYAIVELEHWEVVHEGNYRLMLCSYNQGTKCDSRNYADSIIKYNRELK